MDRAVTDGLYLDRMGRIRVWGGALLVVALLLWVYAAWQLFTPHSAGGDCSAPAFSDREAVHHNSGQHGTALAQRCEAARDWPKPLAALVVALPLSTAGSVLVAYGYLNGRLRMQAALARREQKSD